LCAAFAASVIAGPAKAQTQYFFDWQDPPSSASNGTSSDGGTNYNYISAPILTDATLSAVETYLTNEHTANPTLPLAVKLTGPITNTTANAIFNSYDVAYVFGDFEATNADNSPGSAGNYAALATSYATLVGQVQGSSSSSNALISGFPLSPLNTDQTAPFPKNGPTAANFQNAKLNVASEVLYPGDASFKLPSQIYGALSPSQVISDGLTGANVSNAPNIRSTLFTLPLTRFSEVQVNTGGLANIPYISRFNDANSAAFAQATGNNYTGAGNTVPEFVANNPSASVGYNQLLSRDDFEAMVLHLRMRGATSYQLLDPGVVGYTVSQMESDAAQGWLGGSNPAAAAGLNSMFQQSSERPLTLSTTISVDGSLKTMENAGVVYSGITTGITNNTPPQTGPTMAILISNLDDASHTVNFGTIAFGTLSSPNVSIGAHSHELLQFTRNGSIWTQTSSVTMFSDGSTMTDSTGIGVPEPTSVGLLGMAGFAMLIRRRRKA
jgi:hypothetical protein